MTLDELKRVASAANLAAEDGWQPWDLQRFLATFDPARVVQLVAVADAARRHLDSSEWGNTGVKLDEAIAVLEASP